MSKLYSEIKDLTLEDSDSILKRVHPDDLRREYWELCQDMVAMVPLRDKIVLSGSGESLKACWGYL